MPDHTKPTVVFGERTTWDKVPLSQQCVVVWPDEISVIYGGGGIYVHGYDIHPAWPIERILAPIDLSFDFSRLPGACCIVVDSRGHWYACENQPVENHDRGDGSGDWRDVSGGAIMLLIPEYVRLLGITLPDIPKEYIRDHWRELLIPNPEHPLNQ